MLKCLSYAVSRPLRRSKRLWSSSGRRAARWEEELGAAHPSTARVRYNLAPVLLANGRPREALALSEGAHEMSKLRRGR